MGSGEVVEWQSAGGKALKRHTRATPAGIPRGRSKFTRRQRRQLMEEFGLNVRVLEENTRREFPVENDWDETSSDDCCPTCLGTGFICECPDDICQGRGECMHGDGDVECPDCCGTGGVR